MREELEKLIGFWERVADNGGGGYRQCADDLKRVLDADPVAKLEAMGRVTLSGDHNGCIWLDFDAPRGPSELVSDLTQGLATPMRVSEAAARLLARLDAPAGEGEER